MPSNAGCRPVLHQLARVRRRLTLPIRCQVRSPARSASDDCSQCLRPERKDLLDDRIKRARSDLRERIRIAPLDELWRPTVAAVEQNDVSTRHRWLPRFNPPVRAPTARAREVGGRRSLEWSRHNTLLPIIAATLNDIADT